MEAGLHGEGGPDYINEFEKIWVDNGDYHREDGPARIWLHDGYKQWYLNGKGLTKEEWWERISDEMKLKALFNGEGL
jgi:hypothetical protein